MRLTQLLALALPALSAFAGPLAAQADEIVLVERAADRAGRDRLLRSMSKLRVDLRGEDLPLEQVAKLFRAATNQKVNFAVMSKTVEAADRPKVTIDLRGHPMVPAIGVVSKLTDWKFVYRSGLVQIKPKDEVQELAVLRLYNVTAAVAPLRDRPGPKLSLRAPGEEEEVDEPEETDKTLSGFTIDKIQEFVQNQVDPDSWDRPGVTLSEWNGVLMIRQTERNHAKIAKLLVKLGVMSAPLPKSKVRRKPTANKQVRKSARSTKRPKAERVKR